MKRLFLILIASVLLFGGDALWELRHRLNNLLFSHQMAVISGEPFEDERYRPFEKPFRELGLQEHLRALIAAQSLPEWLKAKNYLLAQLESRAINNEKYKDLVDFGAFDASVTPETLFAARIKKAFVRLEKSDLRSLRQPYDDLYAVAAYLEALGKPVDAQVIEAIEAAIRARERQRFKKALAPLRKLVYSLHAARLDDKAFEKKIKQFLRFNKMVAFDYKNGVEEGKIKIPLEYTEAVMFSARAREILLDIKPNLDAETFEKLVGLYDKISRIIDDKGESADVVKLTKEAKKRLLSATGAKEVRETPAELVAQIEKSLKMMLDAARSGDFKTAEILRIEAYSFFDPDIEQRLIPRDPALSSKLEGLFWDGDGERPGLAYAIDKKDPDLLEDAARHLQTLLAGAQKILETKLSFANALVQSAMIIIREGLEALLVLAVLLSLFKSSRQKRALMGGVAIGVALSFATWWATKKLIALSTSGRELIEGASALLAALMLIFVTAWIFHNTYVKGWVAYAKELAQKAASGGSVALLLFVGFLVVYREGFETVLFYEALGNEAGAKPVLLGFLLGLAIILAAAFALLKFMARLPLQLFFGVTGFFLSLLAVIFTGAGVRGLQTANLLPATPHPALPASSWLSSYLGYSPTVETAGAQLFVAALLLGLYVYAKRRPKRGSAR